MLFIHIIPSLLQIVCILIFFSILQSNSNCNLSIAAIRDAFIATIQDLIPFILGPDFTEPFGKDFLTWAVHDCTMYIFDRKLVIRDAATHSPHVYAVYLNRLRMLRSLHSTNKALHQILTPLFIKDLWFISPQTIKSFIHSWTGHSLLQETRSLHLDLPALEFLPMKMTLEYWPRPQYSFNRRHCEASFVKRLVEDDQDNSNSTLHQVK